MSGVSVGTIAAVVGATAAVAGGAVAYQNGKEQTKAAKEGLAQQAKAADQQKTAAEKLYATQDQANNKANAKGPNTDAMFAQNQIEGQAGGSSTMLTGPTGVDPASLSLGKNTLVGGA